MALSDMEKRYRERLRVLWKDMAPAPTAPEAAAPSLLERERSRSVVLRFKAEERLRVIEQRTEEAARLRGRERGLQDARALQTGLIDEAEDLLVELAEAHDDMERRARREAVDLAVHMTSLLLELLPEALPVVLAPALGRFLETEVGHVGEAPTVTCHPDRRDLLEQLPAVREGRVRLQVDPAAPAGRLRLVGGAGISELDPARGLESMARALAAALAGEGTDP